MKTGIHPEYTDVTVTCVCGNSFQTRSTMGKNFHVEICSECHPFFTGKQKLVDTAGRVDRFRKKYEKSYGNRGRKPSPPEPAPPSVEADTPSADNATEGREEKPVSS